MEHSPALEASELACRRGDALLFAGVNFTLEAGAALWVQGANGVGKTSLLRILAGLAPPAAGSVLWRGEKFNPRRAAQRATLLYLGHTVPLKDDLSVAENLRSMLAFDGVPCSTAALDAQLETVGLAARRALAARYLSLGQRRRLMMARLALAQRTLWLLDEPIIGLDTDAIARFQQQLAAHLASGGVAVLTSHQGLEVGGPTQRLVLS